VAEQGPDQATVALLDKAVVLTVIGAGAREGDARILLPPEAQQVSVEELGAIVGVHLQHGEGDTGQATLEGRAHDAVAAAQDGHTL